MEVRSPRVGLFSARRRWMLVASVGLLAAVVLHGSDRTPSPPRQGSQLAGVTRPAPTDRALRVASFNIHHGVGRDGQFDLQRTAETIRDFDLVALNEVGADFTTSQAQQLAQQLQMGWAFGPAERRWWHDHLGNALLSRYPVAGWKSIPLVGTQGKGFRSYIVAQMPWNGVTLHILVAHLDRQTDRARQLDVILDRFLSLPTPAILLGDLNMRGDGHLLALFEREQVVDAIAASGDTNPHIDWILARGLIARAGGIRETGASDHPCVWAELELPASLADDRTAPPTERMTQ